jgi:integrase
VANLKVTLQIYVKKPEGGWTRYPAVTGKNGRIRPGYGLVGGKKHGVPTKFAEYTYQLKSYEGRRTVVKNVGIDAANAAALLAVTEKRREARHDAKLAGLSVADDNDRKTVARSTQLYIAHLTKKRKFEAASVYGYSLAEFRKACPDVQYLDEINEDVLLDFHIYLRKKGNGERTIANRHGHVKSLLLWCGVGRDATKKKVGDAPKYDKRTVVAYHRDELSTLFAAAEDDPYFWTVLRLLQMAGLREQEAAHLQWPDIDFKREKIHIRSSPNCRDCRDCRLENRGFLLKDREERIIPLPEELADILRERRKVSPKSRLVVGTDDDKPHTKWLRHLKETATEAKLNCGHCENCREYGSTGTWPQDIGCDHWTLHSFRRTYATTLHRAGFTVHQIMDLLGHSDIETTMRYLGSETLETHQQNMRNVSW